jgi:hypothetical protein
MTYRLHKLALLSDWHYRKLYIEISSRGYRRSEPEGAPREVSQVLHKVFNALREEGVSKHDVAAALNVHAEDVNELVFGLALTALEGDGRRAGALGRRPELKVVASKGG